MADSILDYNKLLQVMAAMDVMGDKVFHASTIHKPNVLVTSPVVRDNVADFSVVFEWTFEANSAMAFGDRFRWTRGKNISQYLRRLNKFGETTNLFFVADWGEIEFGVKGGCGLPGSRGVSLVMFVSIPVSATTPAHWEKMKEGAILQAA